MVESPVDMTVHVADLISTQMASIMINRIWRDTHTYIYAAPSRSCEEDQRGPQDTKYCRSGDSNVYYAYMIPDDMEMSMVPWVSVRRPKGYDRLNAFGQNLNLRMVMESSIRAFYSDIKSPFDYENKHHLSWTNSLLEPNGTQLGHNIDILGAFRLPICFDPTGTQFVSDEKVWTDETPHWALKTKFGTKYPCACGPNGEHTEAFRRYSKLDQVAKYQSWCSLPGARGPKFGDGHPPLQVPDVWRFSKDTTA